MAGNVKRRFAKLRIKKDDMVYVLSGKDRGAKGKVLSVDIERERAVVEGINIVKRHRRESKGGGGGITSMPAAIHVSKLAVQCTSCKDHMRPKKKTVTKTQSGREKNFHVRVCSNCGEQMDQL